MGEAQALTRTFTVDGHQLVYDVRGAGEGTVVLIPALLMTRRMQWPLADELAARGHRVVTMDPLGFGASDRPADYCAYSMPIFARQVVAMLDELGVDRAVVGGTSAGANITLAAAALAPERLNGIIVESPVLDQAMLACAVGLTPLLLALTYGRPLYRLLARRAEQMRPPRYLPGDLVREWLSQDPAGSAAAIQGIIYGGAKLSRDERCRIPTRALVLGHRYDPVHPLKDDLGLVDELSDARFLQTRSILELRTKPQRLAPAIAGFVAESHMTEPIVAATQAVTA